jgi:DNA-binding CsgD family transcriptional regulator
MCRKALLLKSARNKFPVFATFTMSGLNSELQRLSELISLIYEGATDPSRWTKDILPAMAQYIEAPECLLMSSLHSPQNGGYFFMYGVEQAHIDLYASKYLTHDVWTIAGLERNLYTEGNVVIGAELVPREKLLTTSFYKEFLSRDENMGQMMASVVFGADSTTSMPTVCSFSRGLHHPVFGEQERERMQHLLPHISRSLGVMQRLRSAELALANTLAALDRLSAGVLLLDSSGAVAFANREANRILEAGDGLRLHKLRPASPLGELSAEKAPHSQAISDAIRAALTRDPYATTHFSKSVSVPRTSGLASYTLQFSALGDHSEFGGASGVYAAIVFMADGARKIDIDPVVLQSAYGLTPAEARVAIALVELESANEVADVLNVSRNTVTTHIKAVYSKLGVDSRARFVKAMLAMTSQRS